MALKTTSIRISADDLFEMLKGKYGVKEAEFKVNITEKQDPKADPRDYTPIYELESVSIISKEKV